MPNPVVAVVGSTIASSAIQARAASKAAKAQQTGIDSSIYEQGRQYDISRADLAPWRDAGGEALSRLRSASQGDFSSFLNSPDYQFRLSEGEKAINRAQAARGNFLSGAGMKELSRYGSNIASGEYGDWWNRQAGLANVGQTATNTTGQFGANAASNIGNAYMAAGNARANAAINQGNAFGGAVNDITSNYLLNSYLNRQQSPGLSPTQQQLMYNPAGYASGYSGYL